jgi:hypothetical protein
MNARTLTLLAAAAVSILAASPGRGQDILEDVRWVSANNTDDGLSKSLVDLYIAMCRGGILRTRDVPSGGGKVESLLRTNRVHYGAALPVQIDELVCSLNPGFCRSNSGGTPANCGQSAAAGSATQPQWLYMPDATLVIPDIAFNEVIRLRPYRRPEGVAHGVETWRGRRSPGEAATVRIPPNAGSGCRPRIARSGRLSSLAPTRAWPQCRP